VHFSRSGYEGALLRDIAADAGSDAALINRYFGGKEGLFAAALKDAIRSDRILTWNRDSVGRDVASTIATKSAHHNEERLHAFQFLLRAATSPATAPLLNEALQEKFMEPIRAWLGGGDANARARLITAVLIGVLVERLVRDEPLEDGEREPFIARLSAILQDLVDNRTCGERTSHG
jgi:AcrR family transcriptional regulator